MIKSSANSSTIFSIYNLDAPESFALSSSPSSSSPCPQSMQQHITSYPKFSFSHGIIAVVSSPPEYARTTFSLLISDSLLNVFLLILPSAETDGSSCLIYCLCKLQPTIHQNLYLCKRKIIKMKIMHIFTNKCIKMHKCFGYSQNMQSIVSVYPSNIQHTYDPGSPGRDKNCGVIGCSLV